MSHDPKQSSGSGPGHGGPGVAEEETGIAETLSIPGRPADNTLTVRCPNCRSALGIAADSPLRGIACPDCGAHFDLATDRTVDWTGGATQGQPIKRIGHFEFIAPLGEGAFGVVWKARDTQLDRTVAIKVPRKGELTREETEQFLREARAAAQLRHPNIVDVHEVGFADDRVYIVSDFIEGLPLDRWLTAQRPTPRETATICAKIAAALEAAHRQGIVHRDLKPGNIMIDGTGEPHLMDFGLAKREASELTMTLEGQILGTPAYMSPEQARGESHQVDRRTDLYSLGVVLFELLTGERPFRGNMQMLLKQIVENDSPSPRTLDSRVPRDLETICLRCLEREPHRRYRSAKEVSEELGRYLRGETILARPIGRLARAGRWCRRNPLIAALTATAGLLLVLVAVVATVGYVNTSNALKGEAHQRKLAEDALYESQQSEARAVAARQQAVAAQQQAQQSAATSLVEQVDLLRRDRAAGWTWKGLENLSKALGMGIKFPDVVKLRSLASSCLMGVDLRQVAAFAPGENSFCAAFSPDGKQLAIAQYKAQAYATCKVTVVSLSDAQTRSYSYSPSMAWQIKHGWVQDGGRSLAFSPDGRWLVVGTRSGWLHRWDLGHNGSAPASWQAHEESVDDLAFSPDGRSLYSASFHEALARWDAANGWKMAARRESKASRGIALSRDGSRLVIAEDALCWLDPNTLKPSGKTIGLKAGGLIRYCGATGLLAAAWNNGIALIDEERAEPVPVRTLSDPEFQVAHSSGMCGLATSPDGSLVASSDTDGRMKLWDVASGRFLYRVAFPGAGNVAPAFSPDGRHIAATADLRVLLFELGGLDTCSTAGLGESAVRTIAVSHDGRSLATLAGGDGSAGKVCCWDADTGGTRSQWHVNAGFDPGMEASLSFHPSGEVLAAGGYVENLLLLRVLDSKVEEWLERRTSTSFVFGADGRTLWRVRNSDEVVGWDPASGKELSHWSNRLANVFTGRATIHTLAAGKSWVVAGSATTGAILLRTSDGQMETRWDSPGGAVTAVAIRRDDSLAALATEKGTIRVVRVPDGHVLGDQKAHADRIASLAFAQDGTSLASASHDGTVCCFRIGDGLVERVVALSFDNRPVEAVCFAQQGRLLAILLRGESGVRVVHLDRLRAGLGALALDWQAGG